MESGRIQTIIFLHDQSRTFENYFLPSLFSTETLLCLKCEKSKSSLEQTYTGIITLRAKIVDLTPQRKRKGTENTL